MADQVSLADLSEPELQRTLIALGPHLFPVTPDLAARVRFQLESEAVQPALILHSQPEGTRPIPIAKERAPGIRRQAPLLPRSWPGILGAGGAGEATHTWDRRREMRNVRLRTWLVAALLLMLIAGGFTLFPEARNAIADRLGLHGVLIRWVDELPTPEPSRVGAPLALGRRVTLNEVQAAVDFPVLVPTAAGFDSPGEIYLLNADQGEMVSFVYPARPGLPESDVTGIGALLTQFQGEADRGLIEKGLPERGSNEPRLEAVSVGGEPGFWISGAPHGVFFVCYDVGECREEQYRLAADVLLWEQGGLTLRLESTLSRDEALAIAESVRAPQ